MSTKKLILVIGATGAQGRAVISALLAPHEDGACSMYSIRALTRDPTTEQAQLLASWGVELFKGKNAILHLIPFEILIHTWFCSGRVEDLDSLGSAFAECYGVYVNIDSFTVGQRVEIYAGIKMFEQAQGAQVKHYVWSGLDYASKVSENASNFSRFVFIHPW